MRGLPLLVGIAACSVPSTKSAPYDAAVDAPADAATGTPNTTITSAPPAFSHDGTATFSFVASDGGRAFECSVDGDTPMSCQSPLARTLADGTHSFSVRAVASSGASDQSPAEHVWTIDTVAPDTTLTSTPPAADNSVTVRFGFVSAEENVAFDCSLDNGPYMACTTDGDVGPISDGAHAFAVRARDRAGNVDSTPAVFAWAVDTSTPDTEILTGPSGSSPSQSASFSFVSPDAGAGATFACALEGGILAACTSPHGLSGLAEGSHTFVVRVRDSVGNLDPTPATRIWTVDLTPPETTITTGPSGAVPVASAGFTFSASEPNVSYACSDDGVAFVACTSPHNLTALAQGPHAFAVRATDAAGHDDPTPALRTWTVDTIAPDVAITTGPATGSTSGPRVVVGFTVGDGAASCSIDIAVFVACSSPVAYNLPAGPHQLRIRSLDAAGNATTIARTWVVACAAPDPLAAAGLLHFDEAGQVLDNAVLGGALATLGADATVELADPAHSSGRFAGGLSFTASESDHVAWPAVLGAIPQITLELWSDPAALAGSGDLVVSGDGRFALRVVGAGATTVQFSISVVDSGGITRTAVSGPTLANTWHHVLASLAQPTLRLWVDGARTELAGVTLGAAPLFDAIQIGGAAATAYAGLVDELWISPTTIISDEAALVRYCPL